MQGLAGGPNLVAAADALGLLPRLRQRPWLLAREAREALEAHLGLPPEGLLEVLAKWLELSGAKPAAVGLGAASGAAYLGPAIDFGPAARGRLLPAQALVANLFVHGETGLDLLCATEPPCKRSADLLRELVGFAEIRWLDLRPPEFWRTQSLDGFGFGLQRGSAKLMDILGDGGG